MHHGSNDTGHKPYKLSEEELDVATRLSDIGKWFKAVDETGAAHECLRRGSADSEWRAPSLARASTERAPSLITAHLLQWNSSGYRFLIVAFSVG
jgi:hypothetical protein